MSFKFGRWGLWHGLALLSLLVCARAVRAQTGPRWLDEPPPPYTFGEALAFQIVAQSDSPITAVTLFYRATGEPRALAYEALFTPGRLVTATYPINLTARTLAPFTTVEYWWELRDEAGGQLLTEPQTFYYDDNRFGWQTLTRDLTTVHWYTGDTEFGQLALDIAQHALSPANEAINATLTDPINIYIYTDEQDIHAVLTTAGQTWASGHANPVLGVVMVAARPGLEASTTLERELPHELTHLLIYNAVGGADGYARVPTWLNEGLAVINQTQPDPENPGLITAARDAQALLSLKNLCGPFPADLRQAQLAYAESESVVRFIQEQFGSRRLAALLATYADGASCESGIQRGLGLSLTELETRWLTEVVQAPPSAISAQRLWPWVILTGIVLVSLFTFLALVVSYRRAVRAQKAASKP